MSLYGSIKSVSVLTAKCCALVEFFNKTDAENALQMTDMTTGSSGQLIRAYLSGEPGVSS
jgi:hypothetical protein